MSWEFQVGHQAKKTSPGGYRKAAESPPMEVFEAQLNKTSADLS